jgi:Domain of unknown function (DUF3463).
MSDGYVKTYKELIETTDWDSYGRGKDPRCANCMAHCGYEPPPCWPRWARCARRSGPRAATNPFSWPGGS